MQAGVILPNDHEHRVDRVDRREHVLSVHEPLRRGADGWVGQHLAQFGRCAMTNDPDVAFGHVEGGGDVLVVDIFEVEQEHLLLSQRADPEHGFCHLVVGAPRECLHRG